MWQNFFLKILLLRNIFARSPHFFRPSFQHILMNFSPEDVKTTRGNQFEYESRKTSLISEIQKLSWVLISFQMLSRKWSKLSVRLIFLIQVLEIYDNNLTISDAPVFLRKAKKVVKKINCFYKRKTFKKWVQKCIVILWEFSRCFQ